MPSDFGPSARPVTRDHGSSPPAVAASVALGLARPYLVGIGGCGMSALARLLSVQGVHVRGSDMTGSETTDALARYGIAVDLRQTAADVPADVDGLIHSAAVKPDHPQLIEATRRGLPVLTYAEALGRTMAGRTGVAIAGTHGKSTTTAMLGCILTDAGLDPDVIVGATCGQLAQGCLAPGGVADALVGSRLGAPRVPMGTLAGRPGLLLAEACEFNRSFHHLRPLVASISYVEADHLDIYGSLDEVVRSFREFAQLVPPAGQGGLLLIGHDGAHRREVTAGLACRVETIGFAPAADWVIGYDAATSRVTLARRSDRSTLSFTCPIPGAHMATNAATAAALALTLGAAPDRIAASIAAFRGLDRRMQRLGDRTLPGGGSVRVYDDYGHHPTEVDATLRALRDHERPHERGGRLVCVFQPHQHSRTRFLLDEFAASFSHADVVIVPHIYFVRDSEIEKAKVSAADLVDRLRQRGVQAMHLYPFEAINEQLELLCRPNDLLVVMGAGPVWQVARDYLARDQHARGTRVAHSAESAA